MNACIHSGFLALHVLEFKMFTVLAHYKKKKKSWFKHDCTGFGGNIVSFVLSKTPGNRTAGSHGNVLNLSRLCQTIFTAAVPFCVPTRKI